MNANPESQPAFPLEGSLKPIYAFSILIAVLMTIASVLGIFFPAETYPTTELLAKLFLKKIK